MKERGAVPSIRVIMGARFGSSPNGYSGWQSRGGRRERFILGKGRVIRMCEERVDAYLAVILSKGDLACPVFAGGPGFFLEGERFAVIRVEYADHHAVCRGGRGFIPRVVPCESDLRAVPHCP